MPEKDNIHRRRSRSLRADFAPNLRADYVELGVASAKSFLRARDQHWCGHRRLA